MAEGRYYVAYKDAWETGEKTVFYVPYLTDVYTSEYATAKKVEDVDVSWFDAAYTIAIVKSDLYTFLLSAGFTDLHLVESGTKYYFSSNRYIVVSKYGYQYFIDDVMVYAIETSGAMTLINCYIPNEETYYTYSTYIYFYENTSSGHSGEFAAELSRQWGSQSQGAKNIFKFYNEIEPLIEDDDPYSAGGNSGEGGGTGTFSGTGDSIEFPNLPTLSAVSTGFITLFNPSIAQMQSLATYMWSDVFDIGLYKTLFADPMDCILGCSIVPVAVPNGGTKTVNVGNVSTGISMTVAASQYVEVDCGTLNVEEFWGSYLDYDPYTKAEIYLPYCGTHALQVDDIMGKAVHVKYHVDILSGACCAYVKCGSSVMYSFVGQCSSSIPISANDWTNVVNGALTIAASVGSLIATGGASAPMAVGAAAAVTGTIYGGGIKQNVEKSGSMGGTGGMLAVQTPYLILTRPRQALPKKQNTYTGYPSFITTKLEDLKGYTEIDSIRITGVPATDAELNELESILKSGVIF